MTDKLVVWGVGGHALVVADIIKIVGEYEIVGFLVDLHPEQTDTKFCNAPILGGREQLDHLREKGVKHVIFGFGDNDSRLKLADEVGSKDISLATAIHPRAVVAAGVSIGEGTVIMAGAVVNPGAYIGKNVIINTCSSIDHECLIEDGAHIGPGAHLGGRVTVGRGAWIGIGATIRDRTAIGNGATVGAGSVVISDIPPQAVAYGVPARVQRSRAANEQA